MRAQNEENHTRKTTMCIGEFAFFKSFMMTRMPVMVFNTLIEGYLNIQTS